MPRVVNKQVGDVCSCVCKLIEITYTQYQHRRYDETLRQYTQDKPLVDRDSITCVLLALAKGAHHLHKHNCGHFDIKPSNILIKWSYIRGFFQGSRIVLADFGLSKEFERDGAYRGTWRGTKKFVSPELAVLKRPSTLKFGDRIDIYAIGVTLKEVVGRTNKRHLWFKDLAELMEDMTDELPSRRPTAIETLNRTKILGIPPPAGTFIFSASRRAQSMLAAVANVERMATPSVSKKKIMPVSAQPYIRLLASISRSTTEPSTTTSLPTKPTLTTTATSTTTTTPTSLTRKEPTVTTTRTLASPTLTTTVTSTTTKHNGNKNILVIGIITHDDSEELETDTQKRDQSRVIALRGQFKTVFTISKDYVPNYDKRYHLTHAMNRNGAKVLIRHLDMNCPALQFDFICLEYVRMIGTYYQTFVTGDPQSPVPGCSLRNFVVTLCKANKLKSECKLLVARVEITARWSKTVQNLEKVFGTVRYVKPMDNPLYVAGEMTREHNRIHLERPYDHRTELQKRTQELKPFAEFTVGHRVLRHSNATSTPTPITSPSFQGDYPITSPSFQVDATKHKKLSVQRSTIPGAGLGLFLHEPAKHGEQIARYSGDLLTHEQAMASSSEYIVKISADLYMCAEGTHHWEGKRANCARKAGRVVNARLLLCKPKYCEKAQRWWLPMVAVGDIVPVDDGIEILTDYGDMYWKRPDGVTDALSSPINALDLSNGEDGDRDSDSDFVCDDGDRDSDSDFVCDDGAPTPRTTTTEPSTTTSLTTKEPAVTTTCTLASPTLTIAATSTTENNNGDISSNSDLSNGAHGDGDRDSDSDFVCDDGAPTPRTTTTEPSTTTSLTTKLTLTTTATSTTTTTEPSTPTSLTRKEPDVTTTPTLASPTLTTTATSTTTDHNDNSNDTLTPTTITTTTEPSTPTSLTRKEPAVTTTPTLASPTLTTTTGMILTPSLGCRTRNIVTPELIRRQAAMPTIVTTPILSTPIRRQAAMPAIVTTPILSTPGKLVSPALIRQQAVMPAIITTPILSTPRRIVSPALIRQAAMQIRAGGKYKNVLTKMGLNLNTTGGYLGCAGVDYKRVQTAVRNLSRSQSRAQVTGECAELRATVTRLTEALTTALKERDSAVEQLARLKERALTAEQRLKERVLTSEKLVVAAEKREQQSVRKNTQLTKTLETTKGLLQQLRSSRSVYQDMSSKYPVLLKERDSAVEQLTRLKERALTAEQLVVAADKREQQSVRKNTQLTKTLETTKGLLQKLRSSRSVYQDMSCKYPVLLKERDSAVEQLTRLKERALTAEQRLKERALKAEQRLKERDSDVEQLTKTLEERDTLIKTLVYPVEETHKNHALHTWPLVAKVLAFNAADRKTILKASKHMHDTLSHDWSETLRKRSPILQRLRFAGKILLTHLFSCVRVNKITVPVEDIIRVIFENVNNSQFHAGGEALEEIRRAVHSAVSERRMSDAKMLLTLGISSFTRGTSMKKYFTHIEPILPGSKVTFLTPDDNPTICNKRIEKRNYSYLSKSVSRGNVVSVSDNRKELRVRYHPPGGEEKIVKVPFAHAHNSLNIYINDWLLEAAKQYKQHLGVGVPPVQTPSVQNHVISLKVNIFETSTLSHSIYSYTTYIIVLDIHTGFKAFYILDIFST